ncbi:hypothetical protein V8J38_16560 [Brevundimonas olei]|uniref:Uncharacterized protein n=1 Tax=Brevundimonas olei TaxID=657642 RepID=A0ABZ2IB29_9CAUL
MNGDDDDGALADHDEGFNDDGPTLRTLAAAIQCWSITNLSARARDVGWKAAVGPTLGEAALAFALPVERIKSAVEWHYWMFLTGDGADADLVIEHEGE